MDDEPSDHISPAFPLSQLTYPLPKIVAAMGRSDTEIVAAALQEAGFARDQFEIIIAEEVKGLGELLSGSELRRLQVRLWLSSRDGLDELEQARHEPVSGQALVQVRDHGNEEQVRVHAILSQHGGHPMHYFGRWTITPLIAAEAKAEDLHRRPPQ